jgi:hypothetical protein
VKTSQGRRTWLTVPVDLKGSASRLLKDIAIHRGNGRDWQAEHWKTLSVAYGKAPHFARYAPFFEWLYLANRWERLAELDLAILRQAFEWFGIGAQVVIASTEGFTGRKSDLVLEHGVRFGADVVVTGTMGRDYIAIDDFVARGIKVVFQDYRHPVYPQRFGEFVSHLAFVDLLFNAGPESRAICLEGNVRREDLA